jgi:hypothetical protein
MLLGPLSLCVWAVVHAQLCLYGCSGVVPELHCCLIHSRLGHPLLLTLPFERVGFLLAGGRAWNPRAEALCRAVCIACIGVRFGWLLPEIERARARMYLGHGALSFGVQSTIRGVIKVGFPDTNTPLLLVAFCPFCLQAAKTFLTAFYLQPFWVRQFCFVGLISIPILGLRSILHQTLISVLIRSIITRSVGSEPLPSCL